MRRLVLALTLLSNVALAQAPQTDPSANLGPLTQVETDVLAALRAGKNVKPADSTNNQLRGEFVQQLMLLDSTAVPSGILSLSGYTITSPINMAGDHPPVTLVLEFHKCDFAGLTLGGTFNHAITFETSKFEVPKVPKGQGETPPLLFEALHSANILLNAISFPKGGVLSFNDVQTSGDVYISIGTDQPSSIAITGLQANEFRYIDAKNIYSDNGIFRTFKLLQCDSAKPTTPVSIANSTINRILHIQGEPSDINLTGTTAASTLIPCLPTGTLDLDSANLGRLELDSDLEPIGQGSGSRQLRLPQTISLSETAFSHISFGVTDSKGATPTAVNGIDFFQKAQFYQPTLLKYQTQLRDEGNTEYAATMDRIIHKMTRSQAVRESEWLFPRLGAFVLYALDLFQQWVFGYGTSIIEPFACSALFVLLGTLVFFKPHVMEPVKADCVELPPAYSGFWYSLELFLPVVDLGLAKFWRPLAGENHRILYARIHQLAGWILIPVIVGVLTGSLK